MAATDQPIIFLRGERVCLRPYEAEDIPLVLRWLNDPDTRRYLTRVFPLSEPEERKFIDSMQTPDGKQIGFTIVKGETNHVIGFTGLHEIDWVHRSCVLGIFLGPKEERGQGLGGEAFRLAMKYAFESINMHRVSLTVWSFNERAIRCYERIGFTREGVDRDARFIDGRYIDVLRYAMLDREWFARYPSPSTIKASEEAR